MLLTVGNHGSAWGLCAQWDAMPRVYKRTHCWSDDGLYIRMKIFQRVWIT